MKKGKGKGSNKIAARLRKQPVPRFRLKQELVRIDREGRELPNMAQKALIQAMIEAGANKPDFGMVAEPEIPTNVVSLCEARKDKQLQPRHPSEASLRAWETSKAINALILAEQKLYAKWALRAKSGAVYTTVREDEVRQMRFSLMKVSNKEGHKPKATAAPVLDTKVLADNGVTYTPLNSGYADHMRHSPHSNSYWEKRAANDVPAVIGGNLKPLDRKFWPDAKPEAKAPSGLPIRMFLSGGKYPPKDDVPWFTDEEDVVKSESPVVYTTPNKDSLEYKLRSHVQWFINNVEPQYWDNFVIQFVTWYGDGPVLNTGRLNAYVKSHEGQNLTLNRLVEAQQDQIKMLDAALADATMEVNLLQQERKLLEYELAHRTGDTVSAEIIKQELYGTQYAKAPDDLDAIMSKFRLFKSYYEGDGPEHAFTRFHFGSADLVPIIREHADTLKRQRDAMGKEFRALRDISKRVKERAVASGYRKYPEIYRFRQLASLRKMGSRIKSALNSPKDVHVNSSLYYSRLAMKRKEYDTALFKKWGTKPLPRGFNRGREIDYQRTINRVVGVRSVTHSHSKLVLFYKDIIGNNGQPIKYDPIMNKRVAAHYLPQTPAGQLAIKTKNVLDKAAYVLTKMEINPIARAKQRKEALKLKERLAQEERERNRARNIARAERKAKRIADAERKKYREIARKFYGELH